MLQSLGVDLTLRVNVGIGHIKQIVAVSKIEKVQANGGET